MLFHVIQVPGIAGTCKRRLVLEGDAKGQKAEGREMRLLKSFLQGWREIFVYGKRPCAQGNPPHPPRRWPTYHLYHVLYYTYLLICLNTPPKWKLLKGQILEATNLRPGLTGMYAE